MRSSSSSSRSRISNLSKNLLFQFCECGFSLYIRSRHETPFIVNFDIHHFWIPDCIFLSSSRLLYTLVPPCCFITVHRRNLFFTLAVTFYMFIHLVISGIHSSSTTGYLLNIQYSDCLISASLKRTVHYVMHFFFFYRREVSSNILIASMSNC